jgi:hypothetical protein
METSDNANGICRDTFMVTLQILAPLIVLPGCRLIVQPLGSVATSRVRTTGGDCELELDFHAGSLELKSPLSRMLQTKPVVIPLDDTCTG